MQTLDITPGDGTRYRVAFSKLTPEQSRANSVGDEGFFFAFGIGNEPLTGYFFATGRQFTFDYVVEKFETVDRGRPWTMFIAFTVLHTVAGSVPDLSFYPDWWGKERESYFARIQPGWAESLDEAIEAEFGSVYVRRVVPSSLNT